MKGGGHGTVDRCARPRAVGFAKAGCPRAISGGRRARSRCTASRQWTRPSGRAARREDRDRLASTCSSRPGSAVRGGRRVLRGGRGAADLSGVVLASGGRPRGHDDVSLGGRRGSGGCSGDRACLAVLGSRRQAPRPRARSVMGTGSARRRGFGEGPTSRINAARSARTAERAIKMVEPRDMTDASPIRGPGFTTGRS